jgi:uncharacterized membrane protein
MGSGHDHGIASPDADQPVTSPTTQRAMFAAVGVLAVVAAIGLVLLWPSGDPPPLASQLGFPGEQLDAVVTGTDVGPCAGTDEDAGILCQDIFIEVTSGSVAGIEGSFQQSISVGSADLGTGDRIVVGYNADADAGVAFYFVDFQRRNPMIVLGILFAAAVVALGRLQGIRALAGLVLTGVVVVMFMFPSMLDGNSPTAVALVSAVVIALSALYLTHGVSERTTVALLGALAALALTAILASVFAAATELTGLSSEQALFLRVASAQVDVRGLVLAGIIIGSLGVLDDVTITQSSAVWQLHRANPGYGLRQLYESAVTIGRDHIASAVNTLVLAYAGAALPLLLLFTQAGRPLTEVATGELVAIEIVRTLVGSIGLVAAVPLTTLLAAVVVTRGSRLAVDTDAAPPAPAEVDEADLADPRWETFGPPEGTESW